MTPEQHKTVLDALKDSLGAFTGSDQVSPVNGLRDAIAIMEADHMPDANKMVSPVPSDAVLMRQALDALEKLWLRGAAAGIISNPAIDALRVRLGVV
jgi:hypothetical protein